MILGVLIGTQTKQQSVIWWHDESILLKMRVYHKLTFGYSTSEEGAFLSQVT